jgi:hypothetical protein
VIAAFGAAVLSELCDVLSVTAPSGATISGTNITATVSNGTASQLIAITVSAGASWKLYSDLACINEITNKTVTCAVGANTVYIEVTAEDGTTKVYTVKVTRQQSGATGGSGSGGGGYADTSEYKNPEPAKEPETDKSADTVEDPGTDPGNKDAFTVFDDVPANAWYTPYVEYVYDNGLMNGTSAYTFSPDAPLTRAMLATILYNHAGKPDASGLANTFSDVAAGQWYTDPVKWAKENGLVNGTGADTFSPEANITREQFAVMLYNYAVFLGAASETAGELEFADANSVSDWAEKAVAFCYENGIISGKPGNIFDPKGNATRAEAATMLTRFIEAMEQK